MIARRENVFRLGEVVGADACAGLATKLLKLVVDASNVVKGKLLPHDARGWSRTRGRSPPC